MKLSSKGEGYFEFLVDDDTGSEQLQTKSNSSDSSDEPTKQKKKVFEIQCSDAKPKGIKKIARKNIKMMKRELSLNNKTQKESGEHESLLEQKQISISLCGQLLEEGQTTKEVRKIFKDNQVGFE